MTRKVKFTWKPYAQSDQIDGLRLSLNPPGTTFTTLPAMATTTMVDVDFSQGDVVATLHAVKDGVRVSEFATKTVEEKVSLPPPVTMLPAPEGFSWEFVDDPPPPPPPATNGFLNGAIRRLASMLDFSDGRDGVLGTGSAGTNVFAMPFGVYAVLEFTSPPEVTLPVHAYSLAGGQWAIAAMSNTLLKILGKQPGQATDYTLDVPVDPLVGRKVYVLFGWDVATKKFSVWVDGKLRGQVDAPLGVGFSASVSPNVFINMAAQFGFTGQAKFKLHDFALVVGKAPAQADADALYTERLLAGFRVGADDVKVWAEAGGPDFARPDSRCLAWVDGKLVETVQVRNNPPTVTRWEAALPVDAGYGVYALRAELFWEAADKLEPNAVAVQDVASSREAPLVWPLVARAVSGVSHIRRDGTIGVEVTDKSEIYVGLYGFGPDQLTDAAYGQGVRDELLVANVGLEAGAILQFPPHFPPEKTIEEYWASTESFRQANAAAFVASQWTGPWSVPQDDLVRDIADSLAPLMARPGDFFEEVIERWVTWTFTRPGGPGQLAQIPRFFLGKDECNLAFGPDPAGTGVNLDPISPYGGIRRISAAFRRTGVRFSWPVSGIGKADQHNVIPWHDPVYSDFVTQYDASGNLQVPWTGATLRQRAEVMDWAASQRDVARPFAMNVSLILGNMETKEPGGEWFKTRASTSSRSIPGQLWVALAYGASILRAYSLERFDHVLPPRGRSDKPDWFELQVRPGTREYYAFLRSATLVKQYSDLILGGERTPPQAPPDFQTAWRVGPRGQIFWAVNLSEEPRLFPQVSLPTSAPSLVPLVMDELGAQATVQSVLGGLRVPPAGVLFLVSRAS
jgi:hypothetical protein